MNGNCTGLDCLTKNMVPSAIFYDSTRLRESEHALRRNDPWLKGQKEAFLASINGAPLEDSLGLLIESATQYMGEDARASFFLLNSTGDAISHITGMGEDYSRAVGDFPVGPDSIGCGLAAYMGKPSIYSDVDTVRTEDAIFGLPVNLISGQSGHFW